VNLVMETLVRLDTCQIDFNKETLRTLNRLPLPSLRDMASTAGGVGVRVRWMSRQPTVPSIGNACGKRLKGIFRCAVAIRQSLDPTHWR
jgi:hypothetical protein